MIGFGTPAWQKYVFLFTAEKREAKARIDFDLLPELQEFWLDNISFQAVAIKMVKSAPLYRIEWNDTLKPKTVQLKGHYIDSLGKRIGSKITVPPFQSILLLKAEK